MSQSNTAATELTAFHAKYGPELEPNWFPFMQLCADGFYELARNQYRFFSNSSEVLHKKFRSCCRLGNERSILIFASMEFARYMLVDGLIECATSKNAETFGWVKFWSNKFDDVIEEAVRKLELENPASAEWLRTQAEL